MSAGVFELENDVPVLILFPSDHQEKIHPSPDVEWLAVADSNNRVEVESKGATPPSIFLDKLVTEVVGIRGLQQPGPGHER